MGQRETWTIVANPLPGQIQPTPLPPLVAAINAAQPMATTQDWSLQINMITVSAFIQLVFEFHVAQDYICYNGSDYPVKQIPFGIATILTQPQGNEFVPMAVPNMPGCKASDFMTGKTKITAYIAGNNVLLQLVDNTGTAIWGTGVAPISFTDEPLAVAIVAVGSGGGNSATFTTGDFRVDAQAVSSTINGVQVNPWPIKTINGETLTLTGFTLSYSLGTGETSNFQANPTQVSPYHVILDSTPVK